MNKTDQSQYPMIFFWSAALMVVSGLLWSVLCFIDLLLHPLHSLGAIPIPLVNLLSGIIIGPVTIGVGILVLRRQSRNVVGLLIMQIGISWMAGSLRADLDVAWIQAINYFFSGSIWTALFLLVPYFPDGRMYPPRYARFVHGIAIYFYVFGWLGIFSEQTILTSLQGASIRYEFENPFYVPAIESYANVIQRAGMLITFGLIGLAIFSLARRIQDGDSHLKRQSLWLLWNMIVFAVFAIIGGVFGLFTFANLFTTIFSLVFFTWLLFFPLIGIAYAILRHKLYDIDIIIRRTLIYGVLTTILGIVYFGGIVLTQQAFVALTGQTSELAIVVSTLLIAALFAPLRRRVQDVIDRRLYRKKYDVEQVLADFQKNLRDEVDMETLKANLVSVVSDTMQPDKIALWVREPKS